MIRLKYFDSVRHLLRSGKVDDPYVLKITQEKIINNKLNLDEIPDPMYHVRVLGYTEVDKNEYYRTKTIPSNKFYVEYDNGVVYFNSTEEGKTVDIEYKGRGVLQFPAERIWVHSPNSWAIDNLQELIDFIFQKEQELINKFNEFTLLVKEKTEFITNYINQKVAYIEGWISIANNKIIEITNKIIEVNNKIDEANLVIDESREQTEITKEVTEECKVNSNMSVVRWQRYVDTYGDIAIKYPVPQNGWTTVAKDTNKIYRYNQYTGNWEENRSLEEIFTPSTAMHNGLMSKDDYNKLQTIQPYAQVNYTGENAKNALPEYVHTKTIVMGEKGLINTGVIGIPIQFPYSGRITNIKAFATTPSDNYVELTINKISDTEFQTGGMWVDILSNHLTINAGNKTNELNIVYNTDLVQAGDYFKVNVLHSNGTLQDLVVQINILY